MCADVIFAAENAQFGLPETRHGIIGECGVVHRAVRQLPQRVAMAMILTGERIDAGTALRHGLVNEVVPTGNLETAAAGWAEKINKCRSEEHTSELQSLMRISYAVFCLKKKKKRT